MDTIIVNIKKETRGDSEIFYAYAPNLETAIKSSGETVELAERHFYEQFQKLIDKWGVALPEELEGVTADDFVFVFEGARFNTKEEEKVLEDYRKKKHLMPEKVLEDKWKEQLADTLNALLQRNHIPPYELARMIGKREEDVQKWLTGEINVTLPMLAKISCALGVYDGIIQVVQVK